MRARGAGKYLAPWELCGECLWHSSLFFAANCNFAAFRDRPPEFCRAAEISSFIWKYIARGVLFRWAIVGVARFFAARDKKTQIARLPV